MDDSEMMEEPMDQYAEGDGMGMEYGEEGMMGNEMGDYGPEGEEMMEVSRCRPG